MHLLARGGPLTLATAVCLDSEEDMKTLAATAGSKDLSLALVAAAFYGKPEKISWLLNRKADPNEWPDTASGFHSHATALHQAVSSGSLVCVQLLTAAGARRDAKDKIYQGTPLDWAKHLQQEEKDPGLKANYAVIEQYLGSDR
jgi:peptide-methionine (S)-S-oxide reductase